MKIKKKKTQAQVIELLNLGNQLKEWLDTNPFQARISLK